MALWLDNIGLGLRRPGFKSPLGHEIHQVTLDQSQNLKLTSQGCCEDKGVGGREESLELTGGKVWEKYKFFKAVVTCSETNFSSG